MLQGLKGYIPRPRQKPNLSLEHTGRGQPRFAELVLYRTVYELCHIHTKDELHLQV